MENKKALDLFTELPLEYQNYIKEEEKSFFNEFFKDTRIRFRTVKYLFTVYLEKLISEKEKDLNYSIDEYLLLLEFKLRILKRKIELLETVKINHTAEEGFLSYYEENLENLFE